MKIAIIGASHAGIACAIRAREEYPDAEIIMYEKKTEISFISQNILFYLLTKDPALLEAGKYASTEQLRAIGIVMKTGVEVRKVNLRNKSLTYIKLSSRTSQFDTFDKIILAMGSYPSIPVIYGETPKNLYILKTLEDALKLQEWIEPNKTALIVGGGTIGVELSRILNKRKVEASIISHGSTLMPNYYDLEAGQDLTNLLAAEGINLYKDDTIIFIEEDEGKIHVKTQEGKELYFDAVILTTGFRPNHFLIKDQIELDEKGAIKVDEYMQTSMPDVFAAGDCTSVYMKLFDRSVYMPHASDALRQGKVAAINLNGPKQKIKSTQGCFVLDMEDLKLCTVGLTLKSALKAGWKADHLYYENTYFGELGYRMWLIYEMKTHRILGAQIIGGVPNVAAYVSILSLAIEKEMTIDDLEFTDFYLEHGFSNPNGFNKIFAKLIRERER